jgi:hypothetical protein
MQKRYNKINRMLKKAEKLLRNGRVESLGGQRFNVIGDHGTYMVVEAPDGKISCSCPGYRTRRRCSHSTAVLLKKLNYQK